MRDEANFDFCPGMIILDDAMFERMAFMMLDVSKVNRIYYVYQASMFLTRRFEFCYTNSFINYMDRIFTESSRIHHQVEITNTFRLVNVI